MSLDRIQSRPGSFVINAEANSAGYPGGYQFGSQVQILAASTGTDGGGGLVIKPRAQTYGASSGTGAMISHDGAGIVLASLSAGGLHNLQPAQYNGQCLTVINVGTGSASLVTGAITSGNGTGSTTTAVIPTLTNALTFSDPSGNAAIRGFVALTSIGGSASNSTYAIWSCTGPNAGTGAVAGGSAQEVFYKTPVYSQTYAASSGTGAMVTHGGAPIVYASFSAGGLHNIQPPTYHGQVLTIQNIANVSGSIVTGAVLNGQGTGSTTTAVIPTLTNAVTFGSSGGASAVRAFVGLSQFGGVASNSTYAVWSCSGIGL